MKKRRKVDPSYRLRNILATALSCIVSGRRKKSKHTFGCDVDTLRKEIESKFKNGMTWDNYGDWEIDHIIPVKNFNCLDKNYYSECWNYKNFQPLWKRENREKSFITKEN